MSQEMTGYPSIDKPWLKYYSEEALEAPLPECTMYDYLYDNNKNNLDAIAFNYFNRRITYGQFFANVNKVAAAFASMGVSEGDIVTICSVSTPETIYAFYALNRLGAISNMVDPRINIKSLHHYIEEVNSKIAVTIDIVADKMVKACAETNVEHIIVLSPYLSLPPFKRTIVNLLGCLKKKPVLPDICLSWEKFIGNASSLPSFPAYKKNVCAVIVHTGGTTGTPKGVMLSNDNLNISAHDGFYCTPDMKRGQTWLNIMPPFIVYGIGNGLHLPLSIGMEVILIPQFKMEEYDKLLLKYHPDHMLGVPSHYKYVVNSNKLKNKDLSFVIAPGIGGETMKRDLEQRTNAFLKEHGCTYKIQKGYGMTEVSAAVTFTVCDECNKLGSVGIPFMHTIISVFDQNTGEELPCNQQGEVCMTGPNTMLGYYENLTETKGVLRHHNDGRVWMHSGDIGYMDENGCLFIVDRIKRMIIRPDGFKVFPSHVEQVISANGSVSDCCVVGKPDKSQSHGMLPVAFVRLEDGANEQTVKQRLISACETELPEYAQPSDFVFVEELPLTPIGKVDYRKLEELAAEQSRED